MRFALPLLIGCLAGTGGAAERLAVGPGDLTSIMAPSPTQKVAHVAAFRLDRRPVTNGEFLAFVRDVPDWRRDRIAALFADRDYLGHWLGPDDLGPDALPEHPVTNISWFAARAYCATHGARLPMWYEWEYAAAADEHHADARQDPAWRARILNWYSHPANQPLAPVGRGPANVYGIQDLHGLVWEWVEDFNALMVSADSRDQGDPDKLAFCGAGALSAEDRENYPLLMRIAFLSALEARSTARSLGFRCATGGAP